MKNLKRSISDLNRKIMKNSKNSLNFKKNSSSSDEKKFLDIMVLESSPCMDSPVHMKKRFFTQEKAIIYIGKSDFLHRKKRFFTQEKAIFYIGNRKKRFFTQKKRFLHRKNSYFFPVPPISANQNLQRPHSPLFKKILNPVENPPLVNPHRTYKNTYVD